MKILADAPGTVPDHALAALSALSEGVVMQLASGEIVACNPAAERILGLTRDQMTGRTSVDPRWRAVHEDGSPFPGETHPAMVTLRTGESFRDVVMGVQVPGGSLRWISVNSEPIPGPEGTPGSVVTTFVDVTDRERAEEELRQSERNLRSFFDTIGDFIFVLDDKGRIVHTNRAVRDRLGYTPDDLVGRGVLEVHPVERRGEAGRIVAGMLAGEAQVCLVPLVAKDGTTIPVETRVVRGRWSGGDALFGISKDLSELQASEERFQKAFRSNPSPMTIRSLLTGRILDVSDAFVRDLGYRREEVVGQTSVALGAVPDESRFHEAEEILRTRGSFRDLEMDVRTRDGRIRHGLFSGEIVDLAHERVFLTVMNDVTQLRQAEAALKESEAKYRLLAANSTDVIGLIGPDGVVRYVSPACQELVGFEPSEMIGRRPSDFVLLEDRPLAQASLARHLAGEDVVRTRYRGVRKDGRAFWAEAISRAIRNRDTGEIVELQAAVRDVTETKEGEDALQRHRDHLEEMVAERTASLVRTNAALEEALAVNRRSEKELRESEERLHLAQEAGRSGAYEWNLRTNEILFTPELERLYGLPSGGFAGRYGSWEAFTHPEDGPSVTALARKAIEERTGFQSEFRITRADGETRWLEVFGRVFCDEAGQPVKVIGLNVDVTERKLAEEALVSSRRNLEQRNDELRALFESASAAMALYDAKPPFRLLANNRRFQESYPEPLRTGGMVGLALPEFAPEAVTSGILDAFRRVAETGQAVSFREFPYDGFPGGRSWWDWHVAPVVAGGSVVALASMRTDVTMSVIARKRVGAEIYRVKEANRELEAFSYSVSHDLRTPLRAVNGFASLLEGRLGGALDEESRRLLETIKQNSLLMGALVDGLVEYTRLRYKELARTRVEMKALAERVVAGLLAGAPDRNVVEVRVAELPSAFADPDLVAAALRHLLSNALKFSAGRPKPVVEVGFEAGPDGPVYFVKDNGIGFDSKYAGQPFGVFHRLDGPPEPGHLGIGLAMVRRIIERHGGWIRADGQVGQGAVFRFSLVPA